MPNRSNIDFHFATSQPFTFLIRGIGAIFLILLLICIATGKPMTLIPSILEPLCGAVFGSLLSYRMSIRSMRILVITIVVLLCVLLIRPT